MVLCDEIWTVGLQRITCAVCRVRWHAILLEDEPGGQPAKKNAEKTAKNFRGYFFAAPCTLILI